MDAPKPKAPPHSIEAEQSLLGALLMENAVFDVVAERLQAEDFYAVEHRRIYAAAHRLLSAAKPADVITVFQALQAAGQDEAVGGLGYINGLVEAVPSVRNAAAYADVVAQAAARRRVMAQARALLEAAQDEALPLDDAVDQAAAALMDVRVGVAGGEPVAISALLPAWIDRLTEKAEGKVFGTPTRIRPLDRLLGGGLLPGQFIVLGARSSMGKSAEKNQIVRGAALSGPVLDLSLEDSAPQIITRHMAAEGRIPMEHLRLPDKMPESVWGKIGDTLDALKDLPIYIDDSPTATLADVRRKALKLRGKLGQKLSLICVDYLQLMQGDKGAESRNRELYTIAAGLKALAKELGVPILALSQLSRKADEVNGPPRMDHLRDSGGIEEAADVIMLLWRPYPRTKKEEDKHKAQIEVVKQKDGPTGTVHLYFDGELQRFEELTYADE